MRKRLLRRDLAGLGGQIAIHDGTAAAGEAGALLHHAGGDLRDVRDFRAAKAEGVAGALRLRFGAESKAEVEVTAENEAARTSAKPALRTVLVKKVVIFGSHWHREGGPC